MQPQPLPQQPHLPPQPQQDGTAFGITSFVLGVLAITTGAFTAAIVGLIMGIVARKRPSSQPGLTTWGIWLNAIALVFWALAFVFVIFFFFAIFGAGVGIMNEIANTSVYY